MLGEMKESARGNSEAEVGVHAHFAHLSMVQFHDIQQQQQHNRAECSWNNIVRQ